MFGFGKKKAVKSVNCPMAEELEKYKKDNVSLLSKLAANEISMGAQKATIAILEDEQDKLEMMLTDERVMVKRLEEEIERLKSDTSKKVTGASALKSMTKTQLKQMRTALEAAPQNAQGFGGSVSVYDKKTKRLSVVPLTSKEQALEIVKKAEQGRVNIVF